MLSAVPVLGFFSCAWVFSPSVCSFLMQTTWSQTSSDKVLVYCFVVYYWVGWGFLVLFWVLLLLSSYACPNWFIFPILHLPFMSVFSLLSLNLPHPSLLNCHWWGFSIFPSPECAMISWQLCCHYRTVEARACHNDIHPESITTVSNADTNIIQE